MIIISQHDTIHTSSQSQCYFQKPTNFPDSKVHGAKMGPIWGRQDPGGPHVDPMNFAIWVILFYQKEL